jgi:hypothetical protein
VLYDAAIDLWDICAHDQVLVVDLDGDGSDEIFLHRRRHAAVISLQNDGLEVIWGGAGVGDIAQPPEDGGNGPDPAEPGDANGWIFDRDDILSALDLLPGGGHEILISHGNRVAVLALRDSELTAVWNTSQDLRDLTGGEGPVLTPGRADQSGGATFLVRSPSTLTEFDARLPGVPGLRQDTDGVVPAAIETDENAGWELSSLDCFVAVDLDDDGVDELLVRRPREVGVLDEREGRLRLVWSSSRFTSPSGTEVVFTGQFIDGGGEEVVVFNGTTLVAYAWDRERESLEPIAEARDELVDSLDRVLWSFDEGRIVDSCRILTTAPQILLVHVDERLMLVGIEEGEFRVLRLFDPTISGWSLTAEDRFQLIEIDSDPERELSIRKGDRLGIVDLSPEPRLLLASELDSTTFELAPLPLFLRGDSNGDGEVDLSDGVVLLDFLFRGTETIPCASGADADDSGQLEISDAIRIFNFLFSGGTPPATPGPRRSGIDPTVDALDCDQ